MPIAGTAHAAPATTVRREMVRRSVCTPVKGVPSGIFPPTVNLHQLSKMVAGGTDTGNRVSTVGTVLAMLPTAFVAWPLMLAVVFAFSGYGKLGDDAGATTQEWTDLGVPDALNVDWLRRAHPWGELALAIGLVAAPGVSAVVIAAGATALCVIYLFLVARAIARPEPTDCACFGENARAPITTRTVVRNVVLLALAVGSVAHAVAFGSPLSTLVQSPASWWWLLAVAVAALTAYLIAPPTAVAAPADVTEFEPGVQSSGDAGEYLRTLTPLANLVDRDGLTYSIVDLSRARAQLLLFVNPGCGSCPDVVAKVPQWRTELPELQIRLVVTQPFEDLEVSQPEWVQYAMHDPEGQASRMLRIIHTPTAVLLGTDGMLAGGPTAGTAAIGSFMDDIAAELQDARASARP